MIETWLIATIVIIATLSLGTAILVQKVIIIIMELAILVVTRAALVAMDMMIVMIARTVIISVVVIAMNAGATARYATDIIVVVNVNLIINMKMEGVFLKQHQKVL